MKSKIHETLHICDDIFQKQFPGSNLQKTFLKIFRRFTGKHHVMDPPFNKIAGLQPATLRKRRIQHRYFNVNFAESLGTISFRIFKND